MSSLKIDGLDALQGKLKKMATLNDVKDVVKINGVE